MTPAILLKRYWWIAGGVLLLLIYFMFDPLESKWMPQCIFYKFTGLQCMGCGSQRVIHALLHGDIGSALHANMLLVISLPFLVFLSVIEFNRTKFPRIYRKVHSQGVIITISAILLAWLILRNILGI